ncbi:fatty acid desaturase [Desulfovibrio sp. X2]|uniref:fatty acid desaturase family protein n=1 Tax=Desulfovibrio sp. X2 TaxID=941449 RepID=UPI000358A2E9|nr:fatty acid desaturase [Desulfovibrio sp. X2]EPR43588.1 fatty acid desaturase [Desulfovibrio sp. X2]
MEYRVPTLLNLAVAGLLLGLSALFFLVLPGLLLPRSAWWLLLLVPVVLASNTFWFAAHESFHFNLHPNRTANELLGRALAVCLGVPFHVVRFGHLQHHRFNGALVDRPDIYDPADTWPPLAWIGYYAQLVGGFYLLEAASFLVFLLPARHIPKVVDMGLSERDEGSAQIKKLARQTFAKPEVVRAVRIDGALALALHGSALWLYGPWWPAFVAALAGRAFLVSLANNLPHYGTGNTDVKSALNVRLPRLCDAALLHFYCHRVHHADPRIPWTGLPAGMAERGLTFQTGWWRAALVQFRGPITLAAAQAGGTVAVPAAA